MLFTFPSRYWYAIDHKKYLALGHSRPGFPRDFTCPAVLKKMLPQSNNAFRLTGLSPSLAELSSSLQLGKLLFVCPASLDPERECNDLATPLKHMALGPSAFLAPKGPKRAV
jgi:hypothetical protein